MKLQKYIPKVFKTLQSLPPGEVISYGVLAKKCGLKNARNIGWILRQNTDPDKVPCYKVVRADGSLAKGYKFGGPKEQKRRLEREGVRVKKTK